MGLIAVTEVLTILFFKNFSILFLEFSEIVSAIFSNNSIFASWQFKKITVVDLTMTLTNYISSIKPELKEKFFSELITDEEVSNLFGEYCGNILGILDSRYFNTIVTTNTDNLKNLMYRSFIEGYMVKSYQLNYTLEKISEEEEEKW